MVNLQAAKAAIGELAAIDKRLLKNLNITKKAVENWDFKTLKKMLAALGEDARLLVARHEEMTPEVVNALKAEQEYVAGADYPGALETALREAGLPIQGSYPRYELIPFKLTVDPGQEAVILSVGRKSERTFALAPQQVAAWVAARYKKLVEKKFDSQQFCRELLDAYRIGNRMAYRQNEVLWGRAVSLTTIYELLTVRRSARQEYPKELYIYDLGRLKEQFQIRYQGYRFEFGFARNQGHALLVIDSQGRESRLSSLIVHLENERREVEQP
jgi:hypothetical protein